MGSDQLLILLPVPLSALFGPNVPDPLPLVFRKLVGMTLPITLTLTVVLQKNTPLFLFSLLVLSLFVWH